jgi:hypothetical protein
MTAVIEGAKQFVKASVAFLNQPIVKEGIKNVASTVTFVFGLIEIYDICQIIQGKKISTEASSDHPQWVQIAEKVIIICAKVSLILSAGVSRPGVFIISLLVGSVFSTVQLDRVFGPNTVFAVNPWHPRHVASIAAVILALPAVVQSAYKGIKWVYKTIRRYQQSPDVEGKNWLTDAKIRLMAVFNTATSRPVLHVGNHIGSVALGSL